MGFTHGFLNISVRPKNSPFGVCTDARFRAPVYHFYGWGAYAVGKHPLEPVVARLAGYSPSAARGVGYLRPLNAFGSQFPYLNTTA